MLALKEQQVSEKVVSRKTFKEAYDSILVNSKIKQVASGELDPSEWGSALSHDIDAAHAFLDNFISDLSVLCKPKNRYLQRESQMKVTLAWGEYPDQLERAKGLWKEFQIQFAALTRQICDNIQAKPIRLNRVVCPTMPLSWFTPMNKTHAIFEWADTPDKVVLREIIDWSYKSPDDFTRKVPADITRTLKLLKQTNYDYKPVILDGTLVSEKNIPFTRFNLDPALVIKLEWEERNLIVRYWKEPFDSEDYKWMSDAKIGSVLSVMSVLFLALGIFLIDSEMKIISFLGCLTITVALLFGFSSILAFVEHFKPNNTLKV